jgi:hypothetical protein
MDHHSSRFVDNGKKLILVEDVEGNVFGNGVERSGLRGAFDLNGFATVELLLRVPRVTVYANLTGLDEKLDARATDVRKCLSEIEIEAKIRGSRVGGEGANTVFCFVFEFKDGYRKRGCLFNATGGYVFGTNGATALALGEHVLRRHE